MLWLKPQEKNLPIYKDRKGYENPLMTYGDLHLVFIVMVLEQKI